MDRAIFILGCGAQGRVIRDIFAVQYPGAALYFVDDNPSLQGQEVNGSQVIGPQEMKRMDSRPQLHIAIGNPLVRARIAAAWADDAVLISAVHPSAVIAPTATVAPGCMVAPGVIINTQAAVGSCCIVNTGAVIEHDTVMDAYACVSPRAVVGGRSHIKTGAFIASGAVVVARTVVGERAVVGMGAIVTRDVPDHTLVYGVPAAVRGRTDEGFNWSDLF